MTWSAQEEGVSLRIWALWVAWSAQEGLSLMGMEVQRMMVDLERAGGSDPKYRVWGPWMA